MSHQLEIRPGSILVSEPFMHDKNFKRSVILLTDYDTEGSIGMVLNKPTRTNITTAMIDFPKFNSPIYWGGPVSENLLFYIHTIGEDLDGAKKITDDLFWGGNYEQLKLMIKDGFVRPKDVRFYVGYSGWDPTQLDEEISEKIWITSTYKKEFTFFDEPKSLWTKVLKSMGGEYALMANFPEDPALN